VIGPPPVRYIGTPSCGGMMSNIKQHVRIKTHDINRDQSKRVFFQSVQFEINTLFSSPNTKRPVPVQK